MSTTDPPAAGRGRRVFHGWWIVAAFAVTQTIGYGSLYYAFVALLHPVAAALRWGGVAGDAEAEPERAAAMRLATLMSIRTGR